MKTALSKCTLFLEIRTFQAIRISWSSAVLNVSGNSFFRPKQPNCCCGNSAWISNASSACCGASRLLGRRHCLAAAAAVGGIADMRNMEDALADLEQKE